ncbi:MAG: SCP2 domain-containing protein [Halioglobus sp.]
MTQVISPTAHTAVLATLESAINHALDLAPNSKSDLAALEDNVFLVQCTSPEIDLYLQAGSTGIRLMGVYEGEITTRVRGAASDFTELATSDDPAASLINGKLTIDGDSAPLLQLQKIVSELDLDWEAPLVNTLGDVVGHQVAQLLRGTFSWGQQASGSLARQLDEFIHEEARLSPPKLELEDFYREVQELMLRTERLQSRTDRLRKRINQHNT